METLWPDLRFGIRTLAKQPGFTAAVVLSLILGMGANTMIFTLVNAVFLRPLPMTEPARLAAIFGTEEANVGSPTFWRVSYPNYLDLRDQSRTFSGILSYQSLPFSLVGHGGKPQRIEGEVVSSNYFDVLGVRAALGRTFVPEEDLPAGTDPVVVVSHGLWQRWLGADPAVVGKTLTLNGYSFTVVGVAPQGFRGMRRDRTMDVWVSMRMFEQLSPYGRHLHERGFAMFLLVGRLRPEVTSQQAVAELATLADRLGQAYPADNRDRGVHMVPLTEATVDPKKRSLIVRAGGFLMTVVGLILLVACVTVANLLLARAQSRRGEIAIRLALGAGRGRLIRQLLTESTLLFLLGGLLSIPSAIWGLRLLWQRFKPPFFADQALDLTPDVRVFAFTLLVSLLTGVLFGSVPALQASKADLVSELRDRTGSVSGGRGRRRLDLRSALVIVQIALSLVALIAAGLFLRSLGRAQQIDPGFEAKNLLTLTFDMRAAAYDEPRAREFFRRVEERVEAVPGIRSAALAEVRPLKGATLRRSIVVGGAAEDGSLIPTNKVGAGYFETAGIAIVQGRGFNRHDREDTRPVAVVNETLARRYWPGQNPVGQRFRFASQTTWREVVGVAKDSKYENLGENPMPFIYLPLAQLYASQVTLHGRTAGDPAALLPTVQKAVQSLDEELSLYDARTISQLLSSALWGPQTAAVLLSLLAALALILATVGIYGVMSYLADQRQREIGLRMALGAQHRDILKLMLGQGMILVAIGAVLGVAGAVVLSRLISGLIYGVTATDPPTFLGVSLLLIAVALFACYLPSRRAARAQPLTSLRHP